MLNLRPWLFSGLRGKRDEYERYLQSHPDEQLFDGVELTLGCIGAVIAARLLFNALFRTRAAAAVQQRATQKHHQDPRKLVEEVWVALGNSVMLVLSVYVMMTYNGGCWFGNTNSCLAGWPMHDSPFPRRLYFTVEMAWYLHLLLKPVLQYGMSDGRDMVVHHVCTLALVVISYALGLTRVGVLVLACFNISNPFLHAAKVANQLGMTGRMAAFGVFAAVFFVTRVLLVPKAILWVTLVDSWRQVPQVVEDFWWVYLVVNLMLLALYALQVMWMWAIIRVLRQAIFAGGEAASHLSTQVDPSKRYGHPAGEGAGDKKAA